MTNTTYDTLINDAIAGAERLCALGVSSENIAVVMTMGVYQEAIRQERILRVENIESMTHRAKLHGYDVGIINESFVPICKEAVKGISYHAGTMVGDIIINDECAGVHRLYTLKTLDPYYFIDIGLTVRFGISQPITSVNRPKDFGETPKHYPPERGELGTADTKELDDFLSSFAKKGALESAT